STELWVGVGVCVCVCVCMWVYCVSCLKSCLSCPYLFAVCVVISGPLVKHRGKYPTRRETMRAFMSVRHRAALAWDELSHNLSSEIYYSPTHTHTQPHTPRPAHHT